LYRSSPLRRPADGFTLIEVLVALSVLAVALASIGGLIASSVRGTRSIEMHMTRLETARAIVTALPDRDQLLPGNFSGEAAGHLWRVDVLPFAAGSLAPPPQARWQPQTVIVTVKSPAGAEMKISTVRLQRRDSR
jgi:general secretion pathway protein I